MLDGSFEVRLEIARTSEPNVKITLFSSLSKQKQRYFQLCNKFAPYTGQSSTSVLCAIPLNLCHVTSSEGDSRNLCKKLLAKLSFWLRPMRFNYDPHGPETCNLTVRLLRCDHFY